MKIAGAVAVVTGGARGFGRAFTEALLKRGAKVCFADVNTADGLQTEKDFKHKYGANSSMFVKCDVTNETDFKDLFSAAIDRFKHVNIMVNNAGILNENEWKKMLDINLAGVIRGTYLAVEHMRKDKGGQGGLVLNVASVGGLFPVFYMPAYVASKHGIVGFTRSWAANPSSMHKFGVSFACLCPAPSETNMMSDVIGVPNPPVVTYTENEAVINASFKEVGYNSSADVADTFIEMVEKEDNNGAVVTISKLQGARYRYTKHTHRL